MPAADRIKSQTKARWRGRIFTRAIAVAAAYLWQWNGDRLGQRPLLGRLASHVSVVLIVILLAVFGGLHWGAPRNSSSEAAGFSFPTDLAPQEKSERESPLVARAYYRGYQGQIIRQAQPHTAIPERPRLEIVTCVVQPGDTTQSIAVDFGLQPTTIMWSNPEIEKAPDLLKVGQTLVILPIDGVYHTVQEGDTLESLAEKYDVDVAAIVGCLFNDLPGDGTLSADAKIIVPGGTKPYERREVTVYQGPVPDDVAGQGIFYWPATGYISQGYWYGHRAIDIANAIGTAIVASDSGYVSFAGWTDIGYGYLIVVDHANGYQTYYAHLSNIFVVEGQVVEVGQVIGAMGSTGNSTGPHLHFEVRYNRYPTNPFIYLP